MGSWGTRTRELCPAWRLWDNCTQGGRPEHRTGVAAGSGGVAPTVTACPPLGLSAGSTMLLRETSLMPHIPGLPALLSMLFAPVMELR